MLLSVSIIALQFSLESYTGLASSTMMEVRDEQDWKHPFPNLVTEEGMVTEVRDLQPSKHCLPRLVTEDGMSMEVRAKQQ